MTSPGLVDQQARDTITGNLDRTLFVEAGAGTGKTRSLVDRIVRILATGRGTATSIVAITFTEAAAAELRDRLRDSLEVAVAAAETPEDERNRCEEALADLDGAAVETIHAFCRRLLAAFPLAAGLPPAFDLLTGTKGDAAFVERWEAWFEAYLGRAADDEAIALPFLRVLNLGGKPAQLYDVAKVLRGEWDRLLTGEVAVPQPYLEFTSIIGMFDELQSYLDDCTDPGDRMALHLRSMASVADALATASRDAARFEALRGLAHLNDDGQQRSVGRLGAAKNWDAGRLSEVRGEVAAMHSEAAALYRGIVDAAVREVAREITAFVLDTAGGRRREGRLEFQDLLVLTKRLLAAQPEVRRAIRQRYSHLFIDEFQDTDPLQAEIAFLLGTDAEGVIQGDWAALPLDEGRLFFVGDPKQSIYRFRRADIDLYQRIRDTFEQSLVRLTQNFRSVPSVISWVNALFEERFQATDGDLPHRQAPHVDLVAQRPALQDGPTTYWFGDAIEGDADLRRRTEAEAIIALLRQVQAGQWLVHAPGEDGIRAARLEDVAILARTRTGFTGVVAALEDAAVPHRVESRTLVYAAQEVHDFITILRAIDDPTDEVALVAALRSPAFACADDDLVRFRAAGGRWDYRHEPPEAVHPGDSVREAFDWLREKHERRWWIPLPRLVDELLAERRFFELAFVDRRPRERWQRLRYVAEQARAFAEEPNATLRGLVDWLRWQASEDAQVQERIAPEPDDDAVRLMTIHASKGLQFPIVILAGLDSPPPSRTGLALWSDSGTVEVRLAKGVQTAGYEAASETDQLLDALEAERLLYVAMTRAEDHLILSCVREARKPTSKAQPRQSELIAAFAEEHPELCRFLTPVATADAAEPPGVEAGAAVEQPGDRQHWIEERRALIDSHSRRLTISATALAREQATERIADLDAGFEKDAPADETPPWRRGRAGTSIGRAVHSVLQTIDLVTGDDLAAIASAQSTAEGVPDRVHEVTRLARVALQSSAVQEAVASGRYWREVYVATEIDGVIVDGFIDLLYETLEGFVVVDYKTDSVGDHNIDDVVERYRPQALAYALILSQQLPRPVLRCEFVFVSAPGGGAVRSVPVTPEGLDALRRRIAG